MDKIKNQLAGVAALLGVIAAIGGGFIKYGEIMTRIDVLTNASKTIDLSMVAVLEEKVKALENIDSTHEHPVTHGHTKPLINAKEIELLKIQLEELKISTANPLSN